MIGRFLRSALGHGDDVVADVVEPQHDDEQTQAAAAALRDAEAALADIDAAIAAQQADSDRAGRELASLSADCARLDAEASSLQVAAWRGVDDAAQRLDAIDREVAMLDKQRNRVAAAARDLDVHLQELRDQQVVAQQALLDCETTLRALELRTQGSRCATAADAFRQELERFIELDNEASSAASRAGLSGSQVGPALANRLPFALSFHLLSEVVMGGLQSTGVQLTWSHAQHRGGLGFPTAALRPFSPPTPKPGDPVAVVGEDAPCVT